MYDNLNISTVDHNAMCYTVSMLIIWPQDENSSIKWIEAICQDLHLSEKLLMVSDVYFKGHKSLFFIAGIC